MLSWRIAAAAVAGERHVAEARPCEDAFATRLVSGPGGPWLIVAVSDGAGSAECARAGSACAVAAFVDAAASGLATGAAVDADRVRAWIGAARTEIAADAAAASRPMRDHAATLLAAIVGARTAAFVQIGDGAIVVAGDEPGSWAWMFEPHKGEYANETSFLSDADAAEKASVAVLDQVPAELALFTDGLENLLIEVLPVRRVVAEFFDRMLPPVRGVGNAGLDTALSDHLAHYLASAPIAARSDDDRTLVLATRLDARRTVAADGGNLQCAAP